MSSTHDGTAIFEKQDFQKPSKAEALMFPLYLRTNQLINQLAFIINQQDYKGNYEQLEETFDKMTALMCEIETLKPQKP